MGEVPVPRSRSQILGEEIRTFTEAQGIPSLKVGGPILSFLEATATSQFRSTLDIFTALDAIDLDTATGVALDAWGLREGVPRNRLVAASGAVDVGDASFVKLATTVFAGSAAPIAGVVTVNVTDASAFPASGSVYLGRGTSRYEGPVQYTSKVDNGTFWTLVLGSPTQRFHNQGETVILAQGGDRTIDAGKVVRVPRSSFATAVDFKLRFVVTLPDGENVVTGVAVTAVQTGNVGNVPPDAVREWASLPFVGATVTNPLRYNNGLDEEDDDAYRERIRHARANRVRGVRSALEAYAVGVVSPDEGRRVLSAAYVPRTGVPALLVVDDGTGYEERTAGVAVERLLESSAGGEQDLALQATPVAKAFVRADDAPPYQIVQGAQLAVRVGGVLSTFVFDQTTFVNPNAATSYEVVSAVNSSPNILFSLRTSDGGTGLVLFARAEDNDDVEVVAPAAGVDANETFAFPSGLARTVLLYRNDRELSKDGRAAIVEGLPVGSWSTLSGPQTLTVGVDGTPAQTYTFVDQDFVDAGTGFMTVGRNTPAAWAAVLQARLPGVSASTDGVRLILTSNRGVAAGAALAVAGGTLVDDRVFKVATAVGLPRDFSLDRSRGLIRLTAPAAPGDVYTAGTNSPRAFLESSALPVTTLGSDVHVWLAPDGAASLVRHGVTASTPVGILAHAVHDWGATLRLEAYPGVTPGASVFDDVAPGDWAVLWDAAFPAAARGAWRVAEVGVVTVGPDDFSTRLILERRVAHAARAGHAVATMVPVAAAPSRVLTCGGWVAPTASAGVPVAVTDSVEIYDPAAQTWTPAAPMATARAYHTATTMNDGRVLVVGGVGRDGAALATAEAYDPVADSWTAVPAYQVAAERHRAVLLADGRVLVAGGRSGATYRTQAAIFSPGPDTWSANVPMAAARARFGVALLADGRVLAAGGETTGGGAIASAELLNPAVPSWSAAAPMPSSRKALGLAGVGAPVTTVIAVGDDRGGPRIGTRTVYNVAGNAWGADTAITGGGASFEAKDLVTLQDGTVLALFGRVGTTPWSASWNGAAWTALPAPRYADAPSREEVGLALLRNNALTLVNRVVTLGGQDPLRLLPTAAAEVYDKFTNLWSVPDAAVASGLLLSEVGLSVVRTGRALQDLTVPAGTGYTASSIAAALRARGATFETHDTVRLRLRTNAYGADGSVVLAAVDDPALGLAPGEVDNDVSFFASSAGTAPATPDFVPGRLLEDARPVGVASATVRVNRNVPEGGATLVLARDHDDGRPAAPNARQGRASAFRTTTTSATAEPQASRLSLRAQPDGGLTPFDRVWASAPYALGEADDLSVVVDEDVVGKNFTIPLYRRCSPAGVYGAQITLKEAGGASLAANFGLAFSFDDFAVLMQARAPLYAAAPTVATMARYYLHGPGGERARVRVSYPAAANAPAGASFDATSGATVDVRLTLPGGVARPLGGIRASTRLGVAVTSVTGGLGTVLYAANLPVASAARDGSNNSTLTLTLPPSVVDHGFVVGDILYLQSSDPSWTSGNVTVTARTATTIVFNNPLLGTGVAAGVNVGTLSADPQGEATFQGAAVVAGDFLRAAAPSGLAASFKGETFRVTASAAGYVQAIASEKVFVGTATTLVWAQLGTASYLAVFASAPPTATAFAASVNALAAATNSTCPVQLAPLGSGAGLVTRSTVEDLADASAWVSLTDGLNHVGTTVPPPTVGLDYQLVLKAPVSAGLIAAGGWAAEDVRLVPSTPGDVARWLPAVSGLFTAAETALVEDGQNVQVATLTPGSSGSVRVQGGLGNAADAIVAGAAQDVGGETVVRVPTSAAAGLPSGAWAEARNTVPASRLGVLTSASVLSSWTAAGYMTFGATALWTQRFLNSNVRLHVERQGRYLALSDPAGANADGAVTFAGLLEGDYLQVTAAGTPTSFRQAATNNLGLFRVVRVAAGEVFGAGGTVWIENALGVEETSEMTVRGIAFDSVLPGDTLQVSHDLWGHANRGTWTVEAVGVAVGTSTPQFANTVTLKVSTADRTPAVVTSPAPALGLSSSLTVLAEGVPGHMVRRVVNVVMDPADGALSLVRLDTNAYSRILGAPQGTVLHTLDKLGFSTSRAKGTDGYAASVGLVGAVNRVIVGDPTDQASYPGVAAAGTRVLVQAPALKRLQISLLVRAVSGFASEDLAQRIREVVVAEVNRVGVGEPVALGRVVREAQAVQGVVAVTVLSPPYDASHDVVSVARDEKPLILSTSDVTITFSSGT